MGSFLCVCDSVCKGKKEKKNFLGLIFPMLCQVIFAFESSGFQTVQSRNVKVGQSGLQMCVCGCVCGMGERV